RTARPACTRGHCPPGSRWNSIIPTVRATPASRRQSFSPASFAGRAERGQMRFWDASAIVPLLIAEASTPRMQALASADPAMLGRWGSGLECAPPRARAERATGRTSRSIAVAYERLAELAGAWDEVDPNDLVREAPARF